MSRLLLIRQTKPFIRLRLMEKTVFVKQKRCPLMANFPQKISGFFLALGLLVLAILPGPGSFFVCIPFFFIGLLRFSYPSTAEWFLGTYLMGFVLGRGLFHFYQQNWIFPEIFALLVLYCVPSFNQNKQ